MSDVAEAFQPNHTICEDAESHAVYLDSDTLAELVSDDALLEGPEGFDEDGTWLRVEQPITVMGAYTWEAPAAIVAGLVMALVAWVVVRRHRARTQGSSPRSAGA
ncbi:MAG: hypothetical protein QM621_10130 [Aeromicrobium sp.]|uniref:hypothetical protein n=1 Tax=Aeromicrobium sp. TaxID=1871063 RepID=UPI0039E241B3